MAAVDQKAFRMTALDRAILPHCSDDIDLWSRGYFGRSMFKYQRHFYHRPQHDKMLIASIRVGKSELAAMGFLHMAQYNPHSRLLNTSISSEQAKIVFTKCSEYCNNPNFEHWVEHVQSSPYPMIRLVNKAELWFRSIGYDAELIRGFEFDLINVDECSYVVRESAIKTLKGRLLGINPFTNRPRLGLFWQMSSPKGAGWVFDRWKKGDPFYNNAMPDRYLSLRATIWDNPLLSRDQIEELMEDYSEAMIRQEFLGEFLENMDAVFPLNMVMAACDDTSREVRYILDQIKVWNQQHQIRPISTESSVSIDINHYECPPQPGHLYVNSWDLGKKPTRAGRNAMVGMVYDITHEPWSQVAFLYREGMGYVEAKSMIEGWHEKYSGLGSRCRTVIDSTGKGDVIQEFMEKERTIDDLEGIVYSSTTKPPLIHAGRIMLERDGARFPFIRKQVDQLSNYAMMDKDLAQDIVMCFCQAMYAGRELVHLSDRSASLQRSLNTMVHYSQRMPQLRLANPRFIESRRSARSGRGTTEHQQLLRLRRRLSS